MPKKPKKLKAKKRIAASKKTLNRKSKKKTAIKRKKNKVLLTAPQGYHSITPYLIVQNASDAIKFYKNCFGATEVLRMEQPDGKIGHAELVIGDAKIMLADEHPDMGARSPSAYGGSPVGIHLYISNVDSVVEKALANGAKVTRPIENMFYGDRSGTIQDPFGHKWHISTRIENLSHKEIKKRAEGLYKKEELMELTD